MARLFILYLCSLTLRSLAVAAVAGILTLPMRSVVGRHAVWAAVLGCLLLMPAADALLPAAMVPSRAPEIVLPVQTFIVAVPGTAVAPLGSSPRGLPASQRDWWQVAAFLWVAVAGVLLGRLSLACGAILRIRRGGLPISQEWISSHGFRFRTPAIRESSAVAIPLTVGLLKPVLILPTGWRDWEEWKLRAVLAHELTHVRRMDWAIAVSASLARCVFWFNPLSWWLERQLSALAEHASDEACVQFMGDAPRYAETLLQFASIAKRGRRWIGGVAMAQYKISSRIERVLGLREAGSGVLSKVGWVAVCILAISSLYISAAAQSRTTAQLPPLSPAEIVRVMQQRLPAQELPATPVAAAPRPPQSPTDNSATAPPTSVLTPTAQNGILRYWTGWVPSAQQPQGGNNPSPVAPSSATVPLVNPNLVGEIKLIVAPVDQALGTPPGQVQIQTSTGNNRFTGTAVWNVQNGALNPNTWTRNGNAFAFALTGAQGRTLSFETSQGGTFSYGCPDCSFVASELGVGALSANTGPGIIFRLSPDGKSVTATCRALECRAGTAVAPRTLKDSESVVFGIPQAPAADPNKPQLTCFSVFGNIKVDGTPFTAADCPGGVVRLPAIFFSITR